MIGARKEVDPETSETSSYQSSKAANTQMKPETENDIKELQAEL